MQKAWAYSLIEGETVVNDRRRLRPRLGSYAIFAWLRRSGWGRYGVRRPPEALPAIPPPRPASLLSLPYETSDE